MDISGIPRVTAEKDLDDKTFRSHLVKIISIPVILIVALLSYVHFQNSHRDSLAQEIDVYDQLEMATVKLEVIFSDMETAVRGYVISEDASFLAPMERARPSIEVKKENIFRLLAGDYELSRRFRLLLSDVQAWEKHATNTIKLRGDPSVSKVELQARSQKGKVLFDSIRSSTKLFLDKIAESRSVHVKKLKRVVWITNLLEVLFALAFALFVAYLVSKQLNELTQSYRSLLEKNVESLNAIEESSRAKDLFLANMSHEIRTPLGAIMGFADLVVQNKSLDAEALNHATFIGRNSRHLLSLIDDLFDLSKISADKLEIHLEMVDLKSFAADIRQTFRNRLADRKIELRMRLDTKIPKLIFTDPVRLRQILSNLIGNALKFSPENSKIDVVFSFEGGVLTVDVIDSGIGIASELQGKIFQAFTQADGDHSRQHGGVGLGLSISKRLAQILDGDLILKSSRLNIGSHFRLTLPLEKFKEEYLEKGLRDISIADGAAEAPAPQDHVDLSDRHILLAEDSVENQILFRIFIESSNANLTIVDNGADAVKEALANFYDLVLMDIQMPGLDGYEALKILRKSNFEKTVIALTAHTMKGEREKCLSAGFDGYLSKPVSQPKLLSTIRASIQAESGAPQRTV